MNEEYKKWVDNNPLRKWRLEKGLSMMQTSTMLGTGISTLQTWERGTNRPKYENMLKIGKLIGIEDGGKAMETWEKWYGSRPGI